MIQEEEKKEQEPGEFVPEETEKPGEFVAEETEEPEESVPEEAENPESPSGQKKDRREKKGRFRFLRGFLTGVIVAAAVLVVLVAVGRVSVGVSYSDRELLDTATEEKIDLLAGYIEENYYEEVEIEDLRTGLFAGLFDNLDVYSQYYTPEEYQDLMESQVEGTYCGIGAGLQQDEETDVVTVIRVYEDSPALEAGLMVGDIILQADEYEATDMDLDELVSHIRGEEGTSVHLLIYRDGEEMEFDIPRRSLSYETVVSEMLADQIGYLEITEFTESTVEQFEKALEKLKEQGMEALIIDLRYNPGGVLDVVCEILDDILPEGLIVYTEDRDGNREDFRSTNERELAVPLAVLVNGSSASASEIFAGAVQDREAGTLIGTTTYGKGVVQSIRALSDGSALKLTTQRYFTPNGTCIQGIGITPDVEIEYEFLGGEEDEYSYDLDNQIQEAFRVLKGE